ncbi:MAG: FapA family protein, partial [Lutispora sp.]|nr:FapA family protein [Lutispora sp.]
DEMQLISMIKGEAKVVDGKVSVFPIYTVDGNVDNSTGNIRFVGKVVVKGNVITGFTVEAEEDVEVFGFVEGAKIFSKGSIILHRGIQGMNKGELICNGDLIAKFIENSKVYAKGDIKTDAIMHSTVFCGKKLEVKGKKGLLVGGEIKVSEEIIAKTVGSPMATATEIEVGINPDVRKKYDDFKVEYDICSDNLIKLSQVVDLLTKLSKKAELTDDKRALLNKSIILKLQTQSKLEGLKKEIQELETYIEDISKGKVKVESIVYPGTKITIGSSSIFIRDQIQFVTFYRAFGEVKIGSFES